MNKAPFKRKKIDKVNNIPFPTQLPVEPKLHYQNARAQVLNCSCDSGQNILFDF